MRSILIWPTKLQNICIAANAKEATEKFWQQPSIACAKLAGAAYCFALEYGQAGCTSPSALLYMRSGLIWPTRLVMALSVAADCAEASEKFWQQSSMAWAAPSSSSA